MASSALDYVVQLVGALPGLIKAGKDVTSLVRTAQAVRTEDRAPTDAEWAALDSQIKGLRDRLHGP